MFVVGTGVEPGFTGTHLSLDSFTLDGNVKHFDLDTQMQHDYRQVYAAIIGDFLGASSLNIIDTEFDAYDQNRLNLISSPILNNPYEKSTHSTSLIVAPNPVVNDTMIQFSSPMWMRGQLQIHDLQGRIVQELIADFSSGTNQIPLHLSHLANGLYVLTVLDDNNKTLASTKFRKQ